MDAVEVKRKEAIKAVFGGPRECQRSWKKKIGLRNVGFGH